MSGSPELGPGETFGFRFSRWTRWLFRLVGLGRRSGVTLTPSELRVRAWPLRVDLPLAALAAVGEGRAPWWAIAGVHTDARGRWIVTGAPGPVVRLDLAEPQEGTFVGMRVRVSRLDLGTADDAGLLRRLSGAR